MSPCRYGSGGLHNVSNTLEVTGMFTGYSGILLGDMMAAIEHLCLSGGQMMHLVIQIDLSGETEEDVRSGKRAFIVPQSEEETLNLGTDIIPVQAGIGLWPIPWTPSSRAGNLAANPTRN